MVKEIAGLGLFCVALAVPALTSAAAQANPVQAPPASVPLARSFKVSGIVAGFPVGQNGVQRQLHATLTPLDPNARRIGMTLFRGAVGEMTYPSSPAGVLARAGRRIEEIVRPADNDPAD